MDFYVQLPKPFFHHPNHIGGMIGDRKNPASPFFFYLQSQTFKKSNGVLICISIKGTIKKFRVCHYRLKKRLFIAGIRQITPSLSCNKQFFSQLLILFQNMDPMSLLPQKDPRSHSGRTASYNHYFCHNYSLLSYTSYSSQIFSRDSSLSTTSFC